MHLFSTGSQTLCAKGYRHFRCGVERSFSTASAALKPTYRPSSGSSSSNTFRNVLLLEPERNLPIRPTQRAWSFLENRTVSLLFLLPLAAGRPTYRAQTELPLPTRLRNPRRASDLFAQREKAHPDSSQRRGSKAARNSSIHTAKPASKLPVNRIRSGFTLVAPSHEAGSLDELRPILGNAVSMRASINERQLPDDWRGLVSVWCLLRESTGKTSGN